VRQNGASPSHAALLLSLEIDELSVSASYVPQVKSLIRRLSMPEAEELAQWALTRESGREILARAEELVRRIAPSLFETVEQSSE